MTLVQKFMDIRKRAFKFPLLGKKTKFIAIPTTSGTGSEVTPFAVISDKANNRKYPIADYSLTPTVAIVDPALVLTVPGSVAADTGMDVLTHATEAYVSQMASDFTDGLALQAIKLVFENLGKLSEECGLPFTRKDAQCVNYRRYGLRQCLPRYFSLNGPQDRCAIPHHPRTDQCHLASIRYPLQRYTPS